MSETAAPASVADHTEATLPAETNAIGVPLIEEQPAHASLGDFEHTNELTRCLVPLLTALDWHGTTRSLNDALPAGDSFDLTDFENTLGNLGFALERLCARPQAQFADIVPCLLLPDNKPAAVVLDADGDRLRVYDAATDMLADWPKKHFQGIAYAARKLPDTSHTATQPSWLKRQLQPYHGLFLHVFGWSALCNVFAMLIPLFVMSVYDRVLGSQSVTTLSYLTAGALALLLFDLLFKGVRSRSMSHVSARVSYAVGNAVLAKIMSLPSALTERANVGAQLSRLRDIDKVRSLLTSSTLTSCLDLPFVALFLLVIYWLSGSLALIPLGVVVAFVILTLLFSPFMQSTVRAAGRESMEKQELLLEGIEKIRTIRATGSEANWAERYEKMSRSNARAGYCSAMVSAVYSNLGQLLAQLSGLGVLFFGVRSVLEGEATPGALIAATMLSSKVIGPVRGVMSATTQLGQQRTSFAQIDNLMAMDDTGVAADRQTPLRPSGALTFDRVTFRYGRDDPELMGVSFALAPGDSMAIIGRNGAGKSTVLKLAAGLYHAQAGRVLLDGRDIRQFDTRQLRDWVGFVPQTPQLFYGSIAENLRLARPGASDSELWDALETAGAADAVMELPNQIDTFADNNRPLQISESLMMRLSLARCYLTRAPYVLMDEPVTGLDFEAEFAFVEALQELRNRSTVMLVTHRPSYLDLTNKVLLLDKGAVRYAGATEEVRDRLNKELM